MNTTLTNNSSTFVITYFVYQGQTHVSGKMIVDTMDEMVIKTNIIRLIQDTHNVTVSYAYVNIQSMNPSFPDMIDLHTELKNLPSQATCNLH